MNTTLKMSVEGDVIKQERSETPENVQNSDTVLNSGPVEPEFVNIKTELPENISIKTEPQSDDEWEQSSEPSWHTRFLETRVSVKVEPTMDRGDDGKIEITVKQEPPDIQTHNNNYNEKLYLRMVNEPTTIDPNTSNDTASEEELCQNATADGKYMCPICHKRFSNKGNVQRHVLLHSRIRLQCSVCCKQFFKQNQLDKHMTTHTNDKKYECTTCGKFFRSSSNLQQHKKIHLEVKPHACDVCFKTFAVRANLLKHQGKSRCKKPLLEPITCKICGKIFQKEFLLKSHLRKHTDEKPFTCETCKMSFKYKSTMIRHIQLHNGIKPYSCKICGKTFTHAGLIKPHMRIHTGEKPYRCPICDRTFAHKHNMLRHTLRHNKIKHLTCDICQKKFPKESRLKYHMRTHTKEKPFSCDICLKNFSHKQNVIRHFQRKHPKEISF